MKRILSLFIVGTVIVVSGYSQVEKGIPDGYSTLYVPDTYPTWSQGKSYASFVSDHQQHGTKVFIYCSVDSIQPGDSKTTGYFVSTAQWNNSTGEYDSQQCLLLTTNNDVPISVGSVFAFYGEFAGTFKGKTALGQPLQIPVFRLFGYMDRSNQSYRLK